MPGKGLLKAFGLFRRKQYPVDPMDPMNLQRNRKTHTKNLGNGFFFRDEPDDDKWAKAVIDLCKIDGDKNNYGKMIRIRLTPDQVGKYHALQKSIAALGSDPDGLPENKRPTINLTVKGFNKNKAPKSSFGIVGGTGPLSDAEMLTKTIEKLQEENFDMDKVHIRLLSAPPPRDDEGVADFIQRRILYGKRATLFSGENHNTMALASNTAHINLPKARFGRKAGRALHLGRTPETRQVQDLVALVVDKVFQDAEKAKKAPKPLVLGTKQAFEAKLYPDRFTARNGTAIEPDEDEADTLQQWIDQAKGGQTSPQLSQQVQQYILKRVQDEGNDPPTHIVLACTELPLALGETGLKALEKQLGNITIIDTEDFFAARYTEMVKANAGETGEAEEQEGEEDQGAVNSELMTELVQTLKQKAAAKGTTDSASGGDEANMKIRQIAQALHDYYQTDRGFADDIGQSIGLESTEIWQVAEGVLLEASGNRQ